MKPLLAFWLIVFLSSALMWKAAFFLCGWPVMLSVLLLLALGAVWACVYLTRREGEQAV